MNIQIDGTGTTNKGAELMLYAVLEQIEEKYPRASILYNALGGDLGNIKTNLSVKQPARLKYGYYPNVIFSKFNFFPSTFSIFSELGNIDILIDASGFRLSDQWNHNKQFIDSLERYYYKLKCHGAKIILLPQAFGPFHTDAGKRSVNILNKYADLIIARDPVSLKFLLEAGGEIEKIRHFPDFTIAVKGVLPVKYQSLNECVCIIPNKRMISHTSIDNLNYLNIMELLIRHIQKNGRKIFLLNHAGDSDLMMCHEINRRFDEKLPVITNLNAKETKGIIGASNFVISSRYHGVASSLNQGIPCIATSWSHKYDQLFKDFNLDDYVIKLNQKPELTLEKIDLLLNPNFNKKLRNQLADKIIELNNITKKMWSTIWEKSESN